MAKSADKYGCTLIDTDFSFLDESFRLAEAKCKQRLRQFTRRGARSCSGRWWKSGGGREWKGAARCYKREYEWAKRDAKWRGPRKWSQGRRNRSWLGWWWKWWWNRTRRSKKWSRKNWQPGISLGPQEEKNKKWAKWQIHQSNPRGAANIAIK